MMTNDELLNKTISFLRFPLTVGVVFIHFNLAEHGFTIHGVTYGLDHPAWYDFLINFFSEVLPQIGVPLFFIISGFLFFYHTDFDGNVYKKKLWKRVRTLLIPYLLWNLIAILVHASYQISFLFPNATQEEMHLSFVRILKTFFANIPNEGIFVMPAEDAITTYSGFIYPINLPMWYVRELMVMILLTPVIFWLMKRMGKWLVIVLGLIYYFYQPIIMPNGGWSVLMCQAAFFFSWGAYYSIHKINFVESLRQYRYAPLVYIPIAVADALTKGTANNLYIPQAGILFGIVSVIVVVAYLLESGKVKVNTTLANSSFFVYALHTLIIAEVGKVVFSVLHLSGNLPSMLLLYVAVPVVTVLLCVVLYVFLKRFVPSFCSLLTGGR